MYLAQLNPKTFWNAPAGSPELVLMIGLALVVGFALFFGLMFIPAQFRRLVVSGVTFLSGLFYVLFWIYPSPIGRAADDKPRDAAEGFAFWLSDAQPVVAALTNIIAAFLIGLGIASLVRIHIRRIVRLQADWFYSVALLGSMVLMVILGYADWWQRKGPDGANMALGVGWGPVQYGKDLLFDGLLQQMDAAMFSLVAFYILSAAYRAFRARSAEATILLVTALIVMLSNLGAISLIWNNGVDGIAHGNPVLQNFRITEIAGWIRTNLQTPSIRGIDFGVGVGLLAMGLRLWLSLERTGGNS